MENITLSINGKKISCQSGMSILDVALENGIKIPTLCHHPHLESIGACRLCLVEDEKSGRLLASCVRLVCQDMVIRTDSPTIKRHRTNIIRLMIASHPESCLVCNQGNKCELRRIAAELGVGMVNLYPMPHYTGLEDANPFIVRDLSKCILCGKCIRADHELVVVGAIDYNLRGFKTLPAAVHNMPLEKSSCTFCGTCVSLCPTGALVAKNTRYVGSPQNESSTICGFCGVGCSLIMGSVDSQIVDVNPSHKDGTVNRSTLCIRGHFAHDFLNVSERLTKPLIRRDGELLPATWEETIRFVGERLKAIRKENGPQSMAFLGSSKCTNEENYLFQKMARVVFGTNNVDNGSYGSGRPVMASLIDKLDGGGRVAPLTGLEKAELIFVIGANPIDSVPVVGYALKRASRKLNVPIIVVDPRKTGLVSFASLWLPVAPHSDCELIIGLAAILYKRQSLNREFIDRFTQDFEEYCEGLSSIDLERVSTITGLDREQMERAVDLMEKKKIAFVVGHGIFQQRCGPSTMDALLNLALMTGSLGGDGKGFYLVSRENNQEGAWDMGAVADYLPGRQSLQDEMNRKHWEHVWGVKLSPDPGLNVVRMIEEAQKENLKVLYIMGENPIRTLPEPELVRTALGNLELLIVQDILNTETTQMAHVVLPGAAFSEKSGSFTNLEGRIQTFEPVVSPPGEAKPDWKILNLLLSETGYPDTYRSIAKIREEIRSAVPMYEEFGQNGKTCWIKETSKVRLFNNHGKGEPICFSPVRLPEALPLDEAYPFKAIFGSLRYHLGSGTRTSYSLRIKDFGLKGEVEISASDAARINLKGGDKVRISSPHGSLSREVVLNRDMRSGLVFIPMAFQYNEAGRLIELTQLGGADSPGWKEVKVKLEKIVD